MADAFDPYEKWLGIPKNKRPLTSYRLLGVEVFESDADRIERRAERRIELVGKQQQGKHGAIAKKVMQQLIEARDCLLDPTRKEKYDRMLRQKLGDEAPPPPPNGHGRSVPPPVPVHVPDDAYESSQDDAAMFNFAANSSSSNGSGGGGGSSGGGASTYSRREGLNENFWVYPVAIGAAGMAILVGAILMVGSSKPLPPVAKKDDAKGKKTDAKGAETTPDSTDPAPVDPLPRPTGVVTKDELVGAWKSTKFEVPPPLDSILKDVVWLFKDDGRYVVTKNFDGGRSEDELGDFTVDGSVLTLKPDTGVESKPSVQLDGKALVIEFKRENTKYTLAKNVPGAGGKKGEDPPPPNIPVVKVDEPDRLAAWGGAVDPSGEDSHSNLIVHTRLAACKPAFSVGSFACDPGQKTAAFGAAKGGLVEVWDLEEGKKKSQVEVKGDEPVALALPSPEKLIVWTKRSGLISFNAATGKDETTLPVPAQAETGANFLPGIAVSPGGKYFAIVRKGVRIYKTADATLCGVIPFQKDSTVVSLGFRPEGTELIIVFQSRMTPVRYSFASVDLANGELDEEGMKHRAGDFTEAAAPLSFGAGKAPLYYVGGEYILNESDLRIVWKYTSQPPKVMVPLTDGKMLVSEASGIAIKQLNFERVETALGEFLRNQGGESVTISPDEPISLDVRATGSVNDTGLIKTRLEQVMKDRLEADGFKVETGANRKLVIEYNEKSAGKKSELKYFDASGEVQTKKVDAFSAVSATVRVSWHNGWNLSTTISDPLNTVDQIGGAPEKVYAAGILEAGAAFFSSVQMPYFLAESALEGTVTLPLQEGQLAAPK